MSQIPWDQIEKEYQQRSKSSAWNPAEVVMKIEKSEYESALADLKEAIEKYPSNEHVVNLYVHCLRKNSQSLLDIQSAKNLLEEFTKKNKAGTMTLFNLGTLFFALEQFNEALEQFEKVYSSDPANSKVLYNIALCNHMLMREDTALSYYQQAINLGNRTKQALLNISVLLCKQNRKAEAKPYLEELKKLYGDDPRVLNNLNVAMVGDANEKEAVRENFELLRKQNPEHPTATYNEAVFEYHETNVDLSVKMFQRVGDEFATTNPLKIFAQLNAAHAFEKLNRVKEARRFFLKIIDHLGRFVDVTDLKQKVQDLQAVAGSMTTSDKKKDLMELKANFSGDDLALNRDLSNHSHKSPGSRESPRRGSMESDNSPTQRGELESPRLKNLENIKEEEERNVDSSKQESESLHKHDPQSHQKQEPESVQKQDPETLQKQEAENQQKQEAENQQKQEAENPQKEDAENPQKQEAENQQKQEAENQQKEDSENQQNPNAESHQKLDESQQKQDSENPLNRDSESHLKQEFSGHVSEESKQHRTLHIETLSPMPYSSEQRSVDLKDELSPIKGKDVSSIDVRDDNISKVLTDQPSNLDEWSKENCYERIEADPQNYDAHLKLGVIWMEEKIYASAIEYFLKCLQLRPMEEQGKAVKYLVDCYIYSGEFERAMNAADDLPKTRATKTDYLMRKGLAYEGLGNIAEARALLVEATNEEPENPLTHLRLGSLLVRQEQLEEGIKSLKKACDLNPENVETRIKLAEAYIMTGDKHLDEALKHFKYVYEVDKNDYDALIGLSQVYEKRGDTHMAIEYALQASKLPEAPINCLFFLGTLYYKVKEFKKAEEQFRKVLKKEVTHVGATIELATILVINKEFEKAKKYFKHALKLDPDNIAANMRYGKVLHGHFGEYEEAIECYRRVVAADETQYKAQHQIGLIHTEQKHYAEAQKAFKACLAINNKYGPAWRGLAQVFFDANKIHQALENFKKALEVDPRDIEAMTQIGNCHYELQDFESAIHAYEKALKEEKTANVLYNIGNSYFMKEEYQKAIDYYKQSIELDSRRAECYYNLGNAYVIIQEFGNAIEPFKKACELDPQNVAAFYNLGNAYLLTKDLDNALRLFEEVLKIEPGLEWRFRIAYVLDDHGESEHALSHIEECLKQEANNSQILFFKAQILEKQKKYSEAIKVLSEISEETVGEENVADKIKDLKAKLQ